MYKYGVIRKAYIKTVEIVSSQLGTAQKNEVLPCSQCTEIKDIVRQTNEDIL